MFKTGRLRKGAVLLQTMIMTVILSMIAVMVMRWVLSRYILANRLQEETVKSSLARGYAEKEFCTYPVPSSASATLEDTGNKRSASFHMTTEGGHRVFKIDVSDRQ